MTTDTTSTHVHPAVGDVFADSFCEARIMGIVECWVVMRRKHMIPFLLHRNELMSSGQWKNQCPICFPEEGETG